MKADGESTLAEKFLVLTPGVVPIKETKSFLPKVLWLDFGNLGIFFNKKYHFFSVI